MVEAKAAFYISSPEHDSADSESKVEKRQSSQKKHKSRGRRESPLPTIDDAPTADTEAVDPEETERRAAEKARRKKVMQFEWTGWWALWPSGSDSDHRGMSGLFKTDSIGTAVISQDVFLQHHRNYNISCLSMNLPYELRGCELPLVANGYVRSSWWYIKSTLTNHVCYYAVSFYTCISGENKAYCMAPSTIRSLNTKHPIRSHIYTSMLVHMPIVMCL